MTYKFRIKELLKNLSKDEYDLAMRKLPSILGMHQVTFSRLINTRIDSSYEPDCDLMIMLASFFSVSVDKLYTIPPKQITLENLQAVSESSTANNLQLII